MTIRKVDLYHVAVALKTKIAHASHTRTTSDNLVVRVTLDSGHVGYGEGVPRLYVTGETIESTFSALSEYGTARAIGHPSDFEAAVRSIQAMTLPEIEADPRGMAANAARSGLEIALLDAFGHAFGRSLGDAVRLLSGQGLSLSDRPARVRYSGAITADSAKKERISAWKMRVYGFSQVKVKVGVEGQDDPSRMKVLRKILGRNMDIRIDANEAWHAADLLDRVKPLLPYRPSVLEQPTPHAEIACLAEMRPRLGVPIVLDESLCGYPDAESAVRDKTADLLNVRLSKCGGIGPSLRIMELAHRNGLGIQLGCHPGETGILSAAGRHVASAVKGIRYLEGSYDRHILSDNLIREDITFGYGGRARPLSGPGLGVPIDEEALERMTVAKKEIRFD